MMNLVDSLRRFFNRTAWEPSSFAGLPSVPQHDQRLRDVTLAAGGLALLLSRVPPAVSDKRFNASKALLHELCVGRHHGIKFRTMCSDASHEVSGLVDVATMQALKRLMTAGHPVHRNPLPC